GKVVGINEFYTSKRCPTCRMSSRLKEDFVGRVTTRRLFCDKCHNPFREILAASNMVVVIRSHLIHNSRSPYLCPIDDDGHYPWSPGGDGNDGDDGDDGDDEDDSGDGDDSDGGDNAPGGSGSSGDNGDDSDDEDGAPSGSTPSRGRATTSATCTKRTRAHVSPSSPGPRAQKRSARH
ncbi:hypothetical protein BGX31_003664, partial [Mortierella sp. GBA43]